MRVAVAVHARQATPTRRDGVQTAGSPPGLDRKTTYVLLLEVEKWMFPSPFPLAGRACCVSPFGNYSDFIYRYPFSIHQHVLEGSAARPSAFPPARTAASQHFWIVDPFLFYFFLFVRLARLKFDQGRRPHGPRLGQTRQASRRTGATSSRRHMPFEWTYVVLFNFSVFACALAAGRAGRDWRQARYR
ncbi:hypothetical protein FA10DRAFT_3374 [Acaromyces ingoldii]|uniref:Uncharacterized protein n=1 Tax=Acaromyces ingoldii TaxID=215250 RepID=A0A316YT38_9BASI|nr:hypothetical protein FA10DRAFT_3374 [Acaromyces ingoldii]PWN92720.1 hypothetical protein FA10DRAFT_3374 [Acaromyces ingoldii]